MIGVERISDNTRLIDLTVGELRSVFADLVKSPEKKEEKNLVYGLDGLAKLFNVSKSQAQRIKNKGTLRDAIKQEGQVIVIDANKALELFGRKK